MIYEHYKIQTYIPHSHLENLKSELNRVVTPLYKNYDFVFSWQTVTGCWRALEGAKPFQGKIGEIETASEIKLEFTILKKDLDVVFQTIRAHHPYETPVIEAFEVKINSPENR